MGTGHPDQPRFVLGTLQAWQRHRDIPISGAAVLSWGLGACEGARRQPGEGAAWVPPIPAAPTGWGSLGVPGVRGQRRRVRPGRRQRRGCSLRPAPLRRSARSPSRRRCSGGSSGVHARTPLARPHVLPRTPTRSLARPRTCALPCTPARSLARPRVHFPRLLFFAVPMATPPRHTTALRLEIKVVFPPLLLYSTLLLFPPLLF